MTEPPLNVSCSSGPPSPCPSLRALLREVIRPTKRSSASVDISPSLPAPLSVVVCTRRSCLASHHTTSTSSVKNGQSARLGRPRRPPLSAVGFRPAAGDAGRQRAVAQFGSALDWGSSGRRFKSCQPDKRTSRSGRYLTAAASVETLPVGGMDSNADSNPVHKPAVRAPYARHTDCQGKRNLG